MINYFFDGETISKLVASVFGFIGKPAPEEYAKAVNELHDPEVMRQILKSRIADIETDPKLSRNEKEALKNDVLAQFLEGDIKHLQACADVVDRDAENRAEIANRVIGGLFLGAAVLGAGYQAIHGIQNYTGQLHIVPKSTR